VRYAQAYSFKYSARPGTPAAAEDDQLPEAVKDERLAALQDLLAAQQSEFNRAAVGRTMPVLFERVGRHPGQATGRSPWMQPVYVAADDVAALAGRVSDVEIVQAKANSLAGRLAA
jgi:tRNA-2-methylthio-N6-dimethylallyladenosine synthase